MTKEQVQAVLIDPLTRWFIHDLGMLYTDVSDGHIHVWDSFLKSAAPPLHTHPWHLDSTVIVGEIQNTRYTENCCSGQPYKMALSHWGTNMTKHYAQFPISEVKDVKLVASSLVTYKAGESYHMDASEIHDSSATDGTVTFVKLVYSGDGASRLYFQGEYTPMEKRFATASEVSHALGLVKF